MAFAPVIPASGLPGYRLLTATETTQRAVFDRQPEIQRDVDYFAAKIGDVKNAADLVADRRLLTVALGAFGMDEEIDKRAFLRRVLEEGSESADAFANRFVDPRYARIARAFGFGDAGGARVNEPGFVSGLTEAYKERQFEIAVGDQDEVMRLALNFRREIATYANANDPEGTAWFSAMGDPPTRRVLEGALGLPSSIGQLDIDRQRDEFRDASAKTFGDRSMAVFRDPGVVEQAISAFIVRATAASGPSPTAPGAAALTLISNAQGFGSGAAQNLTLSLVR